MEQEMMEAHGAAWESVFNSNTKPARYKIQRMFAVMATGYINISKSMNIKSLRLAFHSVYFSMCITTLCC